MAHDRCSLTVCLVLFSNQRPNEILFGLERLKTTGNLKLFNLSTMKGLVGELPKTI